MVTGGVIYPRLGVLVGPLAVAAFAQVHADFAIMSCGGITAEGITNSHGLLIEIQRAMMEAAQRVILCVDHTKFGRQSISQLCGVDAIDTLITDQPPSPEMLNALDKAGVEVIVATHGSPQVLQPGKTTTAHKPKQTDTPPSTGRAKESEPAFSAPDRFVD